MGISNAPASGLYECLSLGNLNNSSNYGLSCLNLNNGLANTNWNIAGRISKINKDTRLTALLFAWSILAPVMCHTAAGTFTGGPRPCVAVERPARGLVVQTEIPCGFRKITRLMKTYCKNVNILDLKLIRQYAWECMEDKLKRRDYSKFMAGYSEYSARNIRKMARTLGRGFAAEALSSALDAVALEIQSRFQQHDLQLPPVRYYERIDGISRKVRVIGIEPIMQQLMEHVAVGCLSELWQKKIVSHQFASLAGRGQLKGAKLIKKWTIQGKARYFVKGDVHHCFPSIKHEVAMKFLKRDIGKNKELLWLVEELLKNHGEGLVIGSLLSQFLCNYLLSYGYRHVMSLVNTRRGKRIRFVYHALFWMDDILLVGNNLKNLGLAMKSLSKYLKAALDLELKTSWRVLDHRISRIDMMGFTISGNGRMKIRSKIFIRARRSMNLIDKGKRSVHKSRRACSHYAYFKHTGVRILKLADGRTVDVSKVIEIVKRVISEDDKRRQKCLGQANLTMLRLRLRSAA